MEMSVQEIKDFWRGYCQRRRIAADVVARGDARIEQDPEYWADHTMDELLAEVTRSSPAQ
jgi:hypothetical protein